MYLDKLYGRKKTGTYKTVWRLLKHFELINQMVVLAIVKGKRQEFVCWTRKVIYVLYIDLNFIFGNRGKQRHLTW